MDADKYDLKRVIAAMVEKVERRLIAKALEVTRWNRRKAAKMLNISYRSLLYKLKRYDLASAPKVTKKQRRQEEEEGRLMDLAYKIASASPPPSPAPDPPALTSTPWPSPPTPGPSQLSRLEQAVYDDWQSGRWDKEPLIEEYDISPGHFAHIIAVGDSERE